MARPRETAFRAAGIYGVIASIAFVLIAALSTGGCSSNTVTEDPYESCEPGDSCTGGTDCVATTLPASSGYSGDFCTAGCSSASDCPSAPSGYDPECIDDGNGGQCYVTCGSSNSCPYSQACLTFSDQNGNPISLCTP